MIFVRITGRAHPFMAPLDVVVGSPQVDVRAQARPVGAAAALVGHPDTSCVHQSYARRLTVELGVGVAADDDLLRGRRRAMEATRSSDEGTGQDLLVASRRSVAEERLTEAVDVKCDAGWELAEEAELFRIQSAGGPGAGLDESPFPRTQTASSRPRRRESTGVASALPRRLRR